MKVVDFLKRSRRWTQGSNAIDRDYQQVDEKSKEAVRFCLVGALYKCYPLSKVEAKNRKLWKTITKLYPNTYFESVEEFNDDSNTDFRKIRKVLREANV